MGLIPPSSSRTSFCSRDGNHDRERGRTIRGDRGGGGHCVSLLSFCNCLFMAVRLKGGGRRKRERESDHGRRRRREVAEDLDFGREILLLLSRLLPNFFFCREGEGSFGETSRRTDLPLNCSGPWRGGGRPNAKREEEEEEERRSTQRFLLLPPGTFISRRVKSFCSPSFSSFFLCDPSKTSSFFSAFFLWRV